MKKRMDIFLRTQDDLRGDMKKNSESLRIYITVNPTKIVRCGWCGTAESDNWLMNRTGIYCSSQCAAANMAGLSTCLFVFSAILVFATFVASRATSDYSFMTILGGLVLGVMISSPCLICAVGGRDSRKRVPRGSRRDKASSDMSLLKTVSGITCPRCDANLDIRKVGEDKVYNCEYCGASGTIELVKTK